MAKSFYTDIQLENGAKVTNVPTPTNSTDAVNKAYVDANIGGGGGGSPQVFKQSTRPTALGVFEWWVTDNDDPQTQKIINLVIGSN